MMLIDKVKIHPDSAKIMDNFMYELDESLTELKEMDAGAYWDLVLDLHEEIYGEHFDEELAKYAVSCMHNEQMKGEKYPIDITNSLAQTVGVVFDTYNEWDWYYVVNMLCSDFYSVVGDAPSTYASLAKAWVNDIDAPDGKAFLYFQMIKENM